MNYDKLTFKNFLTKTDDLNKCVENVYNTKLTFVFFEATYKNPAIINSQLFTNFHKCRPVNNLRRKSENYSEHIITFCTEAVLKKNQDHQSRTSAKTKFSSWISPSSRLIDLEQQIYFLIG
jgi:hypothetical protein